MATLNPYAPNNVTVRARWHAEGGPQVTQTDFMCDYHFRVAKACLMIEEVFSLHVNIPCFFCLVPDLEV